MRNTRSSASPSPEAATSVSSTWEHEQAEHDEQRDLREERKSFVEADELPAISRRRAADGETHEVHGEEAATPDDVRSSEGQSSRGKRCDGCEGPDRARETGEHPCRGEREDHADQETQRELTYDEQDELVESGRLGALDPGDQTERQRDRHRIVAARLGFERAREPAPDLREAQGREDGRCVRGRDDGSEQDGFEPGEVEESLRRDSGQDRGHNDSDGAQERRPGPRRCAVASRMSAALPRRGSGRGRRCRPAARVRRRRTRSRPGRRSREAFPAPGRPRARELPCEPSRARRGRSLPAPPRRREAQRLRPRRHPCGSGPRAFA